MPGEATNYSIQHETVCVTSPWVSEHRTSLTCVLDIDTLDQALVWLGVDRGTEHDFIWAAKVSKVRYNRAVTCCQDIVREADRAKSALLVDEAELDKTNIWRCLA